MFFRFPWLVHGDATKYVDPRGDVSWIRIVLQCANGTVTVETHPDVAGYLRDSLTQALSGESMPAPSYTPFNEYDDDEIDEAAYPSIGFTWTDNCGRLPPP